MLSTALKIASSGLVSCAICAMGLMPMFAGADAFTASQAAAPIVEQVSVNQPDASDTDVSTIVSDIAPVPADVVEVAEVPAIETAEEVIEPESVPMASFDEAAAPQELVVESEVPQQEVPAVQQDIPEQGVSFEIGATYLIDGEQYWLMDVYSFDGGVSYVFESEEVSGDDWGIGMAELVVTDELLGQMNVARL